MFDFFNYNKVMSDAQSLWQQLDSSKSISTIILILAALIVRSIIAAWLDKNEKMPPHVLNVWKMRLQRAVILLIIIMIVVVWAPELRTLAVTLVAVAMAIVIALKEIITCFTGGIIRSNAEGARIGGRIVINSVHGDVAATDMMSTTILEVNDYGQRTGRTIVLPNSFFINHPTVTEASGDRKYLLLTVGIPIKRNDDWQSIENILQEIGEAICDPYIKEARKHFARFNRRYGFNVPEPDPRVLIDWHDPEKITMNLRLAVPANEQDVKRQEIWREVLRRAPVQITPTS